MVDYSKTTLLIPSCIEPSDLTVRLQDSKLRLLYTLEGLENWLTIAPGLRIVICDGSNFDLGEIVGEKYPHKKIECLFFQNSADKVAGKGKGYGEGEIIRYALDNSEYLRDSDTFIKCTGKLWVRNFTDCLEEWNSTFIVNANFSNIFSRKPTKVESIDTRFYVVNKQFYLEHLLAIHELTSFVPGNCIEDIFLRKMIALKMKGFVYSVNPIICGVGGGSGVYYENSLKQKLGNKLKKFFLKNSRSVKDYIYSPDAKAD